MTDIWELGRDLAAQSKEVYSNKSFGRESWLNFLDTHHYWFVEWHPDVKQVTVPISYMRTPTKHRYEHQIEKYGYQGTYNDYQKSCNTIDNVLNRYDYQMYKLWNEQLFSNKEFGQLVLLNKEIYINGAFNYPCYRYDGKKLSAHPGQHLNYSRLFLGLPFKGWISAPNHNLDVIDWIEKNTCQRIRITDDEQIKEILGTDYIAASIQEYSHQQVPGLYPKIPRPIWNGYDNNGNTDWPWDEAKDICLNFSKHPHFDLIMSLVEADDPVAYLSSIATCNSNYYCQHTMINNFAAFLTTAVKSDQNFTLNTQS